ncbi:MAG: LCP family protein [Anaerovoracaceae bacterium]
MRRDKKESAKKHEKKNKDNKLKSFTRVWSILYVVLLAAFVGVLIYMNLLPIKLLTIVVAVLLVISLLIFPALYFKSFKKSRRITALVMSVILMVVYGAGIVYMQGTIDFISAISKGHLQTEKYHVIVKSDSQYQEIDQIKGLTVQTYLTNEINYSNAKSKLKDKENVEYEMIEELSALADGVIDGSYEIVFISDSHYKTICEEHDGFAEASKIIYTVEVPIETKDVSKNVDVTKEPFNIYISGLDVEGEIDVVSRSDVNMIVTVNPRTHKILLTSIPRDYFINLPSKENAEDKLTHTGLYGIEETIGSVEQLLGIDINYFVKVNYTTVTQFVDAIGGIDVDSDYSFTTHGQQVYFNFVEGQNHLDGEHALAFARERKSFPDGDNQRIKNQQEIVKSTIKKMTGSTSLLTKYTNILSAMENYVQINMNQREMKSLIKMQLNDMPKWNIKSADLTGGSELRTCYSTGSYLVYVMTPDPASVVECVDKIVEVMGTKDKPTEQVN